MARPTPADELPPGWRYVDFLFPWNDEPTLVLQRDPEVEEGEPEKDDDCSD